MSGNTNAKKTGQRPNATILRRTLFLLAVCGVAAFVVLAARLYDVQIKNHDYYEGRALGQQLKQVKLTASRGTIYDSNGKVLAMSASVNSVYVSPAEQRIYGEDTELIADGLSEILGVDRSGVLKKFENSGSWYETVKRKIELEDTEKVRLFIKENGLKSVHVEDDTKRYYPSGSLACQVIGYVGIDNDGLEGLEKRYDKYLTGVNGRVVRLKTEGGTDLLFTDYEDYQDAENGSDITLTIDSTIQYYVEKSIAQAIEDYVVLKGAACIAMDPKTFEIKAMASYDNYDLNDYSKVSDKEMERLNQITDEKEYQEQLAESRFRQWRNKALSDTYEPGSVFKIITLAMGLEEGVISKESTFSCSGQMTFPGRLTPMHCWRHEGHHTQTLTEAISNSCNIALTNIGFRVGAERFYDYAEAFGLFDKTGFDLGEASSIWWKRDDFIKWANIENNYSSLAVASFGQTFKITPIQMISAVAASINGGYLMEPYVVKQVTAPDGSIEMSKEPTLIRQAISKETSDIVREILVEVVENGTGGNARVAGYTGRIGGKTGTSEYVDKQAEEGAPEDYIVSFCGFAPAEDPQIIILLLLDSPSSETGLYVSGGVMAAPVVGNMLSDILPYLGVAPQYTEEELENLNVTVPKLVEKGVEEAKTTLKKQGLEYKIIGTGDAVTAQIPAQGATVASGTTVLVYAGEDKPDDTVAVPNLSGRTYSDAKQMLESRGLFIRTTGALKSDRNVTVSVQSVPANTDVLYGSIVEVTLIDEESVELRLH